MSQLGGFTPMVLGHPARVVWPASHRFTSCDHFHHNLLQNSAFYRVVLPPLIAVSGGHRRKYLNG